VGNSDLAIWLREAQRGDQKSWAAIVGRFDRLVWRVAREQGLDEGLARDVAQVTWLRLAESIGTIREPDRLAGWLATTARREAWRVARRARKEEPLEDAVSVEPAELEVSLIADERAAALWAALRSLDELCQRLLRLLLDEVPYRTIAETFGRPVGWVGPTRQRCLKKLAGTTHVQRLRGA
jgi:RNA polymerase sigma factor (sigma-70 family)